jgi:hypothetical protein
MFENHYANENSFNAFRSYQAIKRHFENKSYDYFKYNGKTNITFDKFKIRKDLILFAKLAKKQDVANRVLSNVLKNEKTWIKDIVSEEGETIYLDWKKRIDSLKYTFSNDLSNLDDNYFKNFEIIEGQHPILVNKLLKKDISFETFTILCDISNPYEIWEQSINDKIILPSILLKSKKYLPFLDFDKKNYKKIIKDKFF